jgi:hypothetical protein
LRKEIHPGCPFCWRRNGHILDVILLVVERDTPWMSILLVVERNTPWTSILLALKMDTPFTSILLAVESDTPFTTILLVLVLVTGIPTAFPNCR